MWLLARAQGRDWACPPCLQVTGVAADPRCKGTIGVAIGCLPGNRWFGVCISRVSKGVRPVVTSLASGRRWEW